MSIYQHIHRKSRLGVLFVELNGQKVIRKEDLEKYRDTMRRPCEIRVQLSETERRILAEESAKSGKSRAYLLREAFFGTRKDRI